MTKVAERLIAEATQLAPTERAKVIEALLSSLDQPDPALDAMWAKEAEDRLDAYDRGEIQASDSDEVFTEIAASRKK